jgi:hypothetical protein
LPKTRKNNTIIIKRYKASRTECLGKKRIF